MSEPAAAAEQGADLAARRRKAQEMAYALGVPLYLAADGTISQAGPGERIDPGPRSRPTGHGAAPQAAATP